MASKHVHTQTQTHAIQVSLKLVSSMDLLPRASPIRSEVAVRGQPSRTSRTSESHSNRCFQRPSGGRNTCFVAGAAVGFSCASRRVHARGRHAKQHAQPDDADEMPHYFPGTIDLTVADDSLDAEMASASGDSEEDICELIGFDMGEGLNTELAMPFSEEELREAYDNSGFFAAQPSKQKAAMWLIGPSACGKSTLAPKAAKWAGMEDRGYVTVDGEAFRDAHHGYKAAIEEGHQHGCVWWGAYLGIRENINDEKQQLLEEAMRDGKNLLIPSTCLRREQCVDVTKDLRRAGYTIHVVGVFGEKETIMGRGRKRAANQGKRYDPREFELALMMFAPMLRLCTGMWRMVCTTEPVDTQQDFGGEGPLTEKQVREICEKVFSMYQDEAKAMYQETEACKSV